MKPAAPHDQGMYILQGRHTPPVRGGSSLFFLGICLVLAVTVVLQNNLVFKCLQGFVFILMAALTRQKMHAVGTIVLFVSTVLINLLLREGRILFMIISFPVTEEALTRGLSRGLTLITLFYMSKACLPLVAPFSGSVGRRVSDILYYTHFFAAHIKSLRFPTLLTDLDRLMCLAERAAGSKKREPVRQQSIKKYLSVVALLAGNIILLILHYGVGPG